MAGPFVKLTHLDPLVGTNQPVIVAISAILYIERDTDGSRLWLARPGGGEPITVRVRERPLVVAERLGL